MEVYLNRIDGIDDAIISMFLSKRTLTRELELEIRREVNIHSDLTIGPRPFGALTRTSDKLDDWMKKVMKWGERHITMLRFIDLSFTVYDMHRGAQDDLDSHAMRFQNRIIRSSTRLGTFDAGEMSDFYKGKIVPTDVALAALGIEMPDELDYEGQTYVRGVNGYVLKGHENDKDYKRGLYMLSIPSSFIFKIQLTEFAHVYRERNAKGTANPELKEAVETMATELEGATLGYVNREKLLAIRQ